MRNDPCKKCSNIDYYIKGEFAYCRPCHSEAQKRYALNKSLGISYSHKRPPSKTLEYMLTEGRRGSHKREKKACPQGHPYSGDNVRVSQQSGGRMHRRCRTCERNAKRVKYGLQPEANPKRLTDYLDGS